MNSASPYPYALQREGVLMSPTPGDPLRSRGAQTGGGRTAYGPLGPRKAVAMSREPQSWDRLGTAHFAYGDELGHDLDLRENKDTAFLADPIAATDGRLSLAVLSRPTGLLAATNAGDSVEPLWRSETHESICSLFVFYEMADASIGVARIVRSA